MAKRVKVQCTDLTPEALARFMTSAQTHLPQEDFEIVKALVNNQHEMLRLIRSRGTTIARLRKLFGLAKSEKMGDVFKNTPAPPTAQEAQQASAADAPSTAVEGNSEPADGSNVVATPSEGAGNAAPDAKPSKKKGHGRNSVADYPAARHIIVPHPTLKPGDRCPSCDCGNVHGMKDPVHFLRILGQAPLTPVCHDAEQLRCGACGECFTARPPDEALGEKHDETAASMIAVLRYGAGMPSHRLARLQRDLGAPLPASTQWDVVRGRVEILRPAYDELERQAAQGAVIHDDDSHNRILSVMGKRRALLLTKGELPDPERTGLFTTAIVSMVTAGAIALFYTGRKHAGENLADLLDLREDGLAPPLLMSDALSRNVPEGHAVIEANCITHGRRKFVAEADNYPAECRHVLGLIGRIYEVEKRCREAGLSPEERLRVHQQESGPVMAEARRWMQAQLDEKRTEPNSALGQAFNYLLKRWEKFSVFLRVPGAPLDNNLCERVLKMAIRHRRNSLFYRSALGAKVGDIYMALIHTAVLHHQNPLDYLTQLQRHWKLVAAHPADWMPWNYRETLARIERARLPADTPSMLPDAA